MPTSPASLRPAVGFGHEAAIDSFDVSFVLGGRLAERPLTFGFLSFWPGVRATRALTFGLGATPPPVTGVLLWARW